MISLPQLQKSQANFSHLLMNETLTATLRPDHNITRTQQGCESSEAKEQSWVKVMYAYHKCTRFLVL